MKSNTKIYSLILLIGDFSVLVVSFVAAYLVRVRWDDRALLSPIEGETYLQIFLLLLPFWLIIFAALGLYNSDIYSRRLAELSRLLIGSFVGTLFLISADFVIESPIFPARLVPIYAFAASFLLLAIERNLLWQLRRRLFRYGYGVRNVMLIGSTPATRTMAALLAQTDTSGFHIRAIIGRSTAVPADFKGVEFGSLSEGLARIKELGIDTIVQTEFYENHERNKQVLEAARANHLAYKFIPAQAEFFTGKNTLEIFHGFPIIAVHQTPLIGWGRIVKRLFDIVGSLIGLVIASPILLIVGAVIKLTDPKGPVFYKHRRITRFGEGFDVYKLRSMYWKYSTGQAASKKSDEEIFREMGREDLIEEFRANQKVEKDPRIMPIGRLTRSTSIDELPQLFNVLRGDLSLVGPRPIVEAELRHYKEHGGEGLLLSVKPGVTGLWQVSGRNEISYEERVQLELFYVQHWSFWLDIKILLRTVLVVLKKTGAR